MLVQLRVSLKVVFDDGDSVEKEMCLKNILE